jgi:hypothetical protein
MMYEVRQFNSYNGSVKAKFADLCTSCCCPLREMEVPLPESLENLFPEYLAVTSRCVTLDVRNVSKSLSLQGIFQFWKKPKIVGG